MQLIVAVPSPHYVCQPGIYQVAAAIESKQEPAPWLPLIDPCLTRGVSVGDRAEADLARTRGAGARVTQQHTGVVTARRQLPATDVPTGVGSQPGV